MTTSRRKTRTLIRTRSQESMEFTTTPMFWEACLEDDSEVIPTLLIPTLAKSYLIRSKTETGDTGIHYCCFKQGKQVESLKVLMSYHMNQNNKNNFGWSPLHISCIQGLHNHCEELLSNGADPDSVNNLGLSPIHYACKYGHSQCLNVLLKYNAKLNKLPDNETLLMLAAKHGNTEIIEILTKIGESVSEKRTDGQNAFHYAIKNGNLQSCSALLKAGADINSQDHSGYSSLHHAVKIGSFEITEFLIQNGASVNIRLNSGDSPLHCAVRNKHFLITKLLLDSGANPNFRDSKGRVTINYSIFFLIRNANPYIKDRKGRDPLKYTKIKKHYEFLFVVLDLALINIVFYRKNEYVSQLIDDGASVDGQNFQQYINKLEETIKTQQETISETDLRKELKKELSYLNNMYSSPMIASVSGKNYEAFRILLNKFAEMKQNDYFTGHSALHKAVLNNDAHFVKILLEHNASVTVTDHDNQTPLDIIRTKNFVKCQQVIEHSQLLHVRYLPRQKFPKIVHGTLEKLLERLLTETLFEYQFCLYFLLMFRFFQKKKEMLNKLIWIFENAEEYISNIAHFESNTNEDKIKFLRVRIAIVLETWIYELFTDFHKNKPCRNPSKSRLNSELISKLSFFDPENYEEQLLKIQEWYLKNLKPKNEVMFTKESLNHLFTSETDEKAQAFSQSPKVQRKLEKANSDKKKLSSEKKLQKQLRKISQKEPTTLSNLAQIFQESSPQSQQRTSRVTRIKSTVSISDLINPDILSEMPEEPTVNTKSTKNSTHFVAKTWTRNSLKRWGSQPENIGRNRARFDPRKTFNILLEFITRNAEKFSSEMIPLKYALTEQLSYYTQKYIKEPLTKIANTTNPSWFDPWRADRKAQAIITDDIRANNAGMMYLFVEVDGMIYARHKPWRATWISDPFDNPQIQSILERPIPESVIKKQKKSKKHVHDVILDNDPLEIARQLTLLEFSYFDKIPMLEIKNWTNGRGLTTEQLKESKVLFKNLPNMIVFDEHYNKIVNFVIFQIVKTVNLKKRLRMLSRLIQVSYHLRKLNNYSSLMEILEGFNQEPVLRLKKTWSKLEKSSKQILMNLKKELRELELESQYRNHYKELLPPCIPYIDHFMNDIEEMDKTFVDIDQDQRIQFEKFVNQFKLIETITKFQRFNFRFNPIQSIQTLIENSPFCSNEKLIEMSLICEKKRK
ncbi:ada2a-containing complex component 3 isoform d [Anaeramoeba ignava]|uniref:Ada2a-containing complex component 3 isoform d n=1 Tax=Anaeramoeba ignava TaxID=1746090 RepID=A0A9Q0RF59_ANAIG|nr:ada2a-containing complex component 3 isoform d [Anaeramoeba ignava]